MVKQIKLISQTQAMVTNQRKESNYGYNNLSYEYWPISFSMCLRHIVNNIICAP